VSKAEDEVRKNLISYSFRVIAWVVGLALTVSVAFAKFYIDSGDEEVMHKIQHLDEKVDLLLDKFKIDIPKERSHE